ncbi:hypothetical protein MTO96_046873, partial [Rhipicephalus appendiculatus]
TARGSAIVTRPTPNEVNGKLPAFINANDYVYPPMPEGIPKRSALEARLVVP